MKEQSQVAVSNVQYINYQFLICCNNVQSQIKVSGGMYVPAKPTTPKVGGFSTTVTEFVGRVLVYWSAAIVHK